MDNFTLAFNAGGGNIWPTEEAEALATSIREFEMVTCGVWWFAGHRTTDHSKRDVRQRVALTKEIGRTQTDRRKEARVVLDLLPRGFFVGRLSANGFG